MSTEDQHSRSEVDISSTYRSDLVSFSYEGLLLPPLLSKARSTRLRACKLRNI